MAESADLRTRQQGYRLLSGIDSRAATEVFRKGLEALEKEKPGALLDLLEGAAAKRSDEKVAALLDAYEGSLDPADPVAAFQPALKGGDVEAGKEIFMTHAAGQCSKCHKVNGDGGVAGPELTGIGSRQDHAYLLASLVDPSSVIVPGYGMTMVTLKSGESIGGALLEENDQAVNLKLPDPENPEKQIEKTIPLSGIESRQPPVSAMPPMGYILKKAEIRDLVAYLASLKEKSGKKGH
jgi:putative heme-binding domain-containing protein